MELRARAWHQAQAPRCGHKAGAALRRGDDPNSATASHPLLPRPLRPRARTQEFLQGHTQRVSALALSRSGRLLASGQLNHLGTPADIIIWDLPNRTLLHRLQLQKVQRAAAARGGRRLAWLHPRAHAGCRRASVRDDATHAPASPLHAAPTSPAHAHMQVKIQALSFSPDEATLASLGGADDNSLVLWDVAGGTPICGAPVNSDFVLRMAFLNHDSSRIVTAGNYNFRLWTYDRRAARAWAHARAGGCMQQVRAGAGARSSRTQRGAGEGGAARTRSAHQQGVAQ